MNLFYIYAAYDILPFMIVDYNHMQPLFNSLSCVNAICGKLMDDTGCIVI